MKIIGFLFKKIYFSKCEIHVNVTLIKAIQSPEDNDEGVW